MLVVGAVLSTETVTPAEARGISNRSNARAKTVYVPSAGSATHRTEYGAFVSLPIGCASFSAQGARQSENSTRAIPAPDVCASSCAPLRIADPARLASSTRGGPTLEHCRVESVPDTGFDRLPAASNATTLITKDEWQGRPPIVADVLDTAATRIEPKPT
jgi:hypothetical protein